MVERSALATGMTRADEAWQACNASDRVDAHRPSAHSEHIGTSQCLKGMQSYKRDRAHAQGRDLSDQSPTRFLQTSIA